LKTNPNVMGMRLVLGLQELFEKCLTPSPFVECYGQGLLFCTMMKELKAIKNKEVVRIIYKVLCAFEA
jgi:hypothetical protein